MALLKKSLRAKRMEKNHNRNNIPKLNLVSLMDIFTILVFFLLVNSSDVEVLQADKSIVLPDSNAEQIPDVTLVIMVNNEDILVSGRPVAKVADALNSADLEIAALKTELEYRASKLAPLSEEEEQKGRPITIMGDKAVPYELLKRIMTTCTAAEYRNISLAVNKLPEESGAEG